MSTKLLHTALITLRGILNWPPGSVPMREARATLQESWKVTIMSSFADLSILSVPFWISSQVNSRMCCGTGYFGSRKSNGPASVFRKL